MLTKAHIESANYLSFSYYDRHLQKDTIFTFDQTYTTLGTTINELKNAAESGGTPEQIHQRQLKIVEDALSKINKIYEDSQGGRSSSGEFRIRHEINQIKLINNDLQKSAEQLTSSSVELPEPPQSAEQLNSSSSGELSEPPQSAEQVNSSSSGELPEPPRKRGCSIC